MVSQCFNTSIGYQFYYISSESIQINLNGKCLGFQVEYESIDIYGHTKPIFTFYNIKYWL